METPILQCAIAETLILCVYGRQFIQGGGGGLIGRGKSPGRGLVINNVRLAVNSGEKKTFFTAKRPHLLALNAVKFCSF